MNRKYKIAHIRTNHLYSLIPPRDRAYNVPRDSLLKQLLLILEIQCLIVDNGCLQGHWLL